MTEFDGAFWEQRYREHAAPEGRGPNPWLVRETADLPVGAALDAGCGEGADAIWLASRGWQVTGVDVSPTALRRARRRAASLGPHIAGRVDWVTADLTAWTPAPEHFDLVCAHYVHPATSRGALLDRLAAAVAPGGTLLVVDHHATDEGGSVPHVRVSATDLAAGLDPERWDVAVAETRTRPVLPAEHHEHVRTDAVLRARKRP
jgi:SAM-dependent methyltransferase